MSWQHIEHGYIFERMIGFSLPINGEIAVISYERVHIVPLDNPDGAIHHHELAEGGETYDWKHQQFKLDDRNFLVLGLYGGSPRLSSNKGESLAFGEGDNFSIRDSSGREIFSHAFDDMSGDWRVVTFTQDDKHVLLGLPYNLEIFKRVI